MVSLSRRVYAFFQLIRPFEWSKSFGNMVIAAVAAMYYYNIMDISLANIAFFLLAFMAVGPLLWGGLYALNDWTDREKDKLHPVKRERPIPSGLIPANLGLLIALSFIVLSFVVGYFIGLLFLFCLAIMLLNQLLYTLKPVKLKERPVLDLISGSLINPTFRFYSGWVLFVPVFNAPLFFLLFILGLQFGGYTLYRLSGKKVEQELGFKSSVVVFREKSVKLVAYASIAVSCLSYVLLTLVDFLFPFLRFFGYLPWYFLLYGLLMLAPLPYYKKALKDPQNIDVKKMYHLLYVHYVVFIAGFILLFVVSS